jgi:hypothetical protein
MHAAPKDGSPVLGLFKQTFASPHNDRAVEQWGGTQIVMRHPGLTNESYDCGWNLINGGTGGFPDDWFEGWMPLPVTSASAASSTGALREALSAARGNLEEIEVNALDVGTSNMAQSAIMEIDAALTASAAPSTEGAPSAFQLADMIPEWMAARLLRGEHAIEASEFRQRDEIIGFGLARRAWPNETGDAWQTWLTPLGLEVRDLLAKKMAARTALAGVTAPRHGIYIASKTKHADRWRFLRDKVGEPIISTWIDEAGEGESTDLNDLWRRCLSEAANCALLLLYREPDDVLKGGWIELGAALANGVPVFAVGIEEYTVAKHKGIRHFPDMKSAIAEARTLLKLAPSAGVTAPSEVEG